MSKIETIGDAMLYLGDCREILPTLGKVDAVVTDPPYGVTQNDWDVAPDLAELWRQIEPLCSGPIIINARQPFASRLVVSRQSRFRHEWIWEKNKATGHLNANHAPLLAHETVLVFAESAPVFRPQLTSGHRPANAAVRRVHSTNYGSQRPTDYGGSTNRYPRSVLNIPVVNNDDQERHHPTQKPVELCDYFLRSYSDGRETILDPFMGSGTTGVACRQLGRPFIGIEIDSTYFDIACRRIEQAARQPDMFIERPEPAKQLGWDEMWSKPFEKAAE